MARGRRAGLLLCRPASSARLVRLGRGHEGDHHRGPQFTDCVRMVHFMRNALSLVPKAAQQMVGATIRTVFAQPDSESAREQWRRVSESFSFPFPETLGADGGSRGGCALLRHLPCRALAEDLVEQPPGASQQGSEEEDQRGRHIPDRGIGDKACGLNTLRATRRVAGLQTLLQRWVLSEAGSKGGTDGRTASTGRQLRSTEERSCTGLFTHLTGHILSTSPNAARSLTKRTQWDRLRRHARPW